MRRAFSLVELLVAIGIISILLGLLLPALSAARRQAARVQCLSQQRQIGTAAFGYADRHDGFLPLGGEVVAPLPNGIDNKGLANALGDSGQRRYRYVASPNTAWLQEVIPPELAIASESSAVGPDTVASMPDAYARASRETLRLFRCPAVQDSADAATSVLLTEAAGSIAFVSLYDNSQTDYAFNGWLMGYDANAPQPTPLAGHLVNARRSASLILLTDASPKENLITWLARRDHGTPTLAGVVRDPASSRGARLDERRHRGTINILFADGHAETIRIDERALDGARLEH